MAQSTAEISVRLTPAGVADVVTALRKVTAESAKAKKENNELVDGLKELIPTIGLLEIANSVREIGKAALESADSIGKLQEQVGSSVESLSALRAEANLNEVSNDDFSRLVVKLTHSLSELSKGSEEQVNAFADLGLSAKDFKGLDISQSFALIAQKTAGMANGVDKANAIVSIFSRNSAKLIPLLNDLGEKGLDGVRAAAEAAGTEIGGPLADAADALNKKFIESKQRSEALATQFLVGFLPSVLDGFAQFNKEIGTTGPQSFATLGEAAGKFFLTTIEGLKLVGDFTVNASRVIAGVLTGAFKVAAQGLKFNIGGAIAATGEAVDDVWKDIQKGGNDLAKDYSKVVSVLNKTAPTLAVKPEVDKEAAAKAQQDLADASGAGIAKAQAVLATLNKSISANQLKSISDLTKNRDKFLADDIAARTANAQAAAVLATNQVDAAQKVTQTELDGIAERTAAAQDEYKIAVLLTNQKEATLKAAAQTELTNSQANARVQAQITKQTNDEQEKNAEAYYAQLVKLNADYIAQYKTAQSAIKAIDKEIQDNRKDGDKIIQDLRLAQLTDQQQFQARINIANSKLDDLQDAVLTGNLEKARDLRNQVVALAGDIAKATAVNPNAINIGAGLIEDANGDLEDLLNKQKTLQTANAKTAQAGIASTADQIATLQKSITDLNAQSSSLKIGIDDKSLADTVAQIKKALLDTPFNISVSAQLQGVGNANGNVQGFADGGVIGGSSPSPRADNHIIAATAGEFVSSVPAVRHYGVGFMEALNDRRIPRFADGGMVGGAGGDGDSMGTLDLTVSGRPIGTVQGDRDSLNNLVKAITALRRGTTQ